MRPIARAVLAVIGLGSVVSAQVRVEATVNATRIGVEDVLVLTVTVEGGAGEPQLRAVDGFRVQSRSTSQSVSIVGGQMASTNSYLYQLLPHGEGTFRIGPIPVEVGGRIVQTNAIEVEVVAGSVLPRGGGRRSPFGSGAPFGRSRRAPALDPDDVYMRAEVSKTSAYQGEEVIVTYRLFSRYVPLGPQIEDDPPLTGFWVEDVELRDDDAAERRTIDGKDFYVFPLKRRILFPTKPGAIEIPSFTISTAFRLTSGDPFDSFFSRGSEPIVVRSSPITMNVKALPTQGRPRDFAGAVGKFELTAALNRDEVEAGDAVTLTLAIQGHGNLRSVDSPPLPDAPGFRTFDPKTDERVRASRAGLSGRKQWEYVLVPESSGTKEIGPWSFPYFDPETGRYAEATASPLKLLVSGDAAVSAGRAPAPGARGEVTLLRQDIRFLKPPPETLGSPSDPFYGSAFFYLTLLLPVLWNVGFIVYLKRREQERTHSSLFRRRRAQRMAESRLKRAATLASEGSQEFYEEIAAALYKYVGDKKSVSPSGLTSQSIDALLEQAGVDADVRGEFSSVLAACEEARFTPGDRSTDEMASLRDRTEALIVSLARVLK